MLRLKSTGPDVERLQRRLKDFEPRLPIDGIFGPLTERAVRLAQRRLSVFPDDGIAGPKTLAALDAGQNKVTPREAAIAVASLRTSRSGRRFIIAHEAMRGVSDRLHWPGGVSGVTLGPGYDMGARQPDFVIRDLLGIGIPRPVASSVARAAGLKGHSARDFVNENKNLVRIDLRQEAALLDQILPHYEAMVKSRIRIPLYQYEFDALVSYAYNPGSGWRKTTQLVNQHLPREAMAEIARHVRSGPTIVASLVRRRQHEARLFLYGIYQ